jgi:UDP-GlcNAc:undecaprenyl-phosphate GlcNAc-1-phosphate transferase
MVLASPVQTQTLSDLLLLLLGGITAFVLSYVLMFGIISLCRKVNLIRPTEPERKQDTRVRLGGVAIYLAFVIASLIFYVRNPALYASYNRYHDEATMYWLFLAFEPVVQTTSSDSRCGYYHGSFY